MNLDKNLIGHFYHERESRSRNMICLANQRDPDLSPGSLSHYFFKNRQLFLLWSGRRPHQKESLHGSLCLTLAETMT